MAQNTHVALCGSVSFTWTPQRKGPRCCSPLANCPMQLSAICLNSCRLLADLFFYLFFPSFPSPFSPSVLFLTVLTKAFSMFFAGSFLIRIFLGILCVFLHIKILIYQNALCLHCFDSLAPVARTHLPESIACTGGRWLSSPCPWRVLVGV